MSSHPPDPSHAHGSKASPKGLYLLTLSIASLGIVYGDIGTSPLYAIKECFYSSHSVPVTPGNVYGILSLIFWSLIIVITIKYIAFVLRADNEGEGGIIALMSLTEPGDRGWRKALLLMGLFGAALLYGDGMITPAITVLSAIEGLEVATPIFTPWVIPITIVILIGLFLVQKRGTAGIGAMFGPVMVVWFAVIGTLGAVEIARNPAILRAVDPRWGAAFFRDNGWAGFLALGTVFLVVTGGEALYADMGHFGRRPIRVTWMVLVLPALLLNYFGQGALLLLEPEAARNPFFLLAPSWLLYPLVILSTAAGVIASQALISGAFSLTSQATQMGLIPRVDIEHTSAREIGQIYIPGVNRALMIACIGLVIGFRSSTNLAAAYGVAVTTTMVITTILFYVVAREHWKWGLGKALTICGLFLAVDLAFFGANIVKIPHGGWFPLVAGGVIFAMMTTWRTGRIILDKRLTADSIPLDALVASLAKSPPHRVPGTAVFMHRRPGRTPTALLHSLKHYKVLHQTMVLLTIATSRVPWVAEKERSSIEHVGSDVFQVTLRYGFMETPDVPAALQRLAQPGLPFDPATTSYFLGRETLIVTKRPGMARWREHLFASMTRNATNAASFFNLPPNRVVELGAQIEL